jgi:cell division protein FtsQ
VLVGTGVAILSIAAIRVKRDKTCKGYKIAINGEVDGRWFIDKKDVMQLLTKNGKDTLYGKSTRDFDLQQMELRLERDQWIKDAELYFDNKQVLQVKITEREPVARVITVGGASFYIDSSCKRLSLSKKMSAKVPVFTGFPSEKILWKPADRVLIREIKEIGAYIMKDPFWMAQISQVDITSKRTFEMIPTIGNHVIDFGAGTDCNKKFNRLFVFYKQVLCKTGMEKYARINVQYEKQVIGIRNSYTSKLDSIKFVKAIEYLIASSQKIDSVKTDSIKTDSVATTQSVKQPQELKANPGPIKDDDQTARPSSRPGMPPKDISAQSSSMKDQPSETSVTYKMRKFCFIIAANYTNLSRTHFVTFV